MRTLQQRVSSRLSVTNIDLLCCKGFWVSISIPVTRRTSIIFLLFFLLACYREVYRRIVGRNGYTPNRFGASELRSYRDSVRGLRTDMVKVSLVNTSLDNVVVLFYLFPLIVAAEESKAEGGQPGWLEAGVGHWLPQNFTRGTVSKISDAPRKRK